MYIFLSSLVFHNNNNNNQFPNDEHHLFILNLIFGIFPKEFQITLLRNKRDILSDNEQLIHMIQLLKSFLKNNLKMILHFWMILVALCEALVWNTTIFYIINNIKQDFHEYFSFFDSPNKCRI